MVGDGLVGPVYGTLSPPGGVGERPSQAARAVAHSGWGSSGDKETASLSACSSVNSGCEPAEAESSTSAGISYERREKSGL